MSIEARRQAIYSEIAQIHESGKIAPPRTWISKFSVTKPSGKRYIYYRVVESDPSRPGKAKMVRYLGSKRSRKYKQFVGAIERRNRLQELERQLKRMEEFEKEVSGGNENKRANQKPPLTKQKTSTSPSPLHHLQQQIEDITAQFEQLLQLFQQEQQERLKLSQKLAALVDSA